MTPIRRGDRNFTVRGWTMALAFSGILHVGAASQVPSRSIIVEAVAEGSSAQRAGVEPGDVFTAWQHAAPVAVTGSAVEGELSSPFDLEAVEIQQAPRGAVRLRGFRGHEPLAVTLPPGRWLMKSRPALGGPTRDSYSKARALLADGRVAEGADALQAAAAATGDEAASAWLLTQAALALDEANNTAGASSLVDLALAKAEGAANETVIAGVQEVRARLSIRRNEPADAEDAYRVLIAIRKEADGAGPGSAAAMLDLAVLLSDREGLPAAEQLSREAVGILRRAAPASVALGRGLSILGNLVRARGNFDDAAPLLREGMEILERQVPDGVDFAIALNHAGHLLWRRGSTTEAAAQYERALGILQRVEPDGAAAASSLMGLGIAAFITGRLAEADGFYRRALALELRLAPGSPSEARALNNLGNLLYTRGDYSGAERYLARALALHERNTPDGQNVASTLHNLGLVHYDRGDVLRAEDYLKRALELKERLAPGGFGSATTLESLANIFRNRGEPDNAEPLLLRALALKERQSPRSVAVAATHANLGNLALDRGDLVSARVRYETAREMLEQAAPDGLEMAIVLTRLVEVAERGGEISGDQQQLTARSVSITEQLAPRSATHAFGLRRMARLARDRGELDRAAAAFAQALDTIESQSRRLGGSDETRTAFAGRRRAMYYEYMDVLMALGQPVRAFDVLERSRARALLMMIAERDLAVDRDLTEELKQTLKELREEDDRLQASLARLHPQRDSVDIKTLNARHRDLRERRSQIIESVRSASPRLAALQYPQPLDLTGVQQALDRGTVLLSYQVGADVSRLFVVRPSSGGSQVGLDVHTIAVGEARLRQHVADLRRLIERDAEGRSGAEPAFVEAARRLYDLLVAPAAAAIGAAERLLIATDGPLHSLPFAALVKEPSGSTGRSWQYLVEWKPLHTTVSATVYAEQRRMATPWTGPPTLVAFGDPHYSADATSGSAIDSDVRGMLRLGYSLAPLPATRTEVQRLSRGFGPHATVLLGPQATEERAKAVARTKYLHFATHGLLDARAPLNSALALTIPGERSAGKENGLLQAWEVFEQLRIDADLVTLSACETALGEDVAGEGLIGLTRAFHYAGARSVLASLWPVADDSTATLMARLYARLRSGASKDAALRQAQMEAIDTPATAAPFHWAAFTLSGDWR